MSFVHRNIAVLLTALLVCAVPWLFGGTRASVMRLVVPWLVALTLEALLFFPQRHGGETSYQARERVWGALRKDPLVWTALGFLALLAVPFLNAGPCPNCDAAAIAAGLEAAPPVKFLPSCVDRMHHLGVFLWFLPALAAAVAAKHALTKDGKLLLLETVVWNGVALAVVGALQQTTDAPGPLWLDPGAKLSYFFSTFGYPNMAGDYFTTIFLLAAGLWRQRVEDLRDDDSRSRHGRGESTHGSPHRRFWHRHYLLIAMAFAFFATLNTLSRASILIVSLAALLVFLHSCISFLTRMKRAQRVKAGATSALAVVATLVVAMLFMPSDVRSEIDTVEARGVLDRVSGKGEGHTERAVEIWREHPLFGCGGWGYRHLAPQHLDVKGKRGYLGGSGSANVHNDYLQFLCEHGLVGFALLVALVGLLLTPVLRIWPALARSVRFMSKRDQPPAPQSLFVLPAGAFFTLLAAAATLGHAFGDCPLRCPAVLILFFTQLAALDGYLPYVTSSSERD